MLVLVIVGALFLAHSLAPSPGWRTFLEVGIVIVGYGLIALWLETHPASLLDRPSAEVDGSVDKSRQGEMPASLSSPVQVHFYIGSDPAIIYQESECPTSHLRTNGHHLARTVPSLPEETTE
jgi:hypothetical protein